MVEDVSLRVLYAQLLYGLVSADDAARYAQLGRADLSGPPRRDEVLRAISSLLDRGLSHSEAGRILAQQIAIQITSGEVLPYQGARTIWTSIVQREPDLEKELRPFIGLASEWEDDPASRESYEHQIRDEARELTRRYSQIDL